jgi:hypothetical protein
MVSDEEFVLVRPDQAVSNIQYLLPSGSGDLRSFGPVTVSRVAVTLELGLVGDRRIDVFLGKPRARSALWREPNRFSSRSISL